MKILHKNDALRAQKPNGPEVWYYLFKEYEIHYNEQPPKTIQTWHYHEKINETIYLIDGQMVVKWREGEQVREQILSSGDLVETERNDHTFENRSDKIVKFLVIKQVLSGEDKSDIFKNDKVITE